MTKNAEAKVHKKSLRDHMTVAFHRKWLFLIPCVLATALLVAGTYSLPKKYRATAFARRMDQALMAAGAMAKADSERTSLSIISKEILVPKQLVNVLKRPEVLKVLKDPNLVNALSREWDKMGEEKQMYALDELQDSLEKLKNKISLNVIAQKGGFEIIEISVTDTDPERARVLANAIGVTYEEYHRKVLEERALEAVRSPKALLDEAKTKLEQIENTIEKFRTDNFASLPEAKLAVLKRRADLETEIPRVENSVTEMAKKVEAHRAALKEQPRKITQKLSAGESPEAAVMRDHLRDLELALKMKLQTLKESHPDVRQLQGEIAATKEQIAQMEKTSNAGGEEIEVDNPLWQAMTSEEAQMVDDLRALQSELNSLKNERRLLNERIKGFSPEAYQYNEMLRKQKEALEDYERYKTMVKESQLVAYMDKEKQGTTVKVYSPALKGKLIFPPHPALVMILALGAGIGTGIGFVLLGEMADHSFRTVEDASEYLDVPILGTVGTIKPAVSVMKVWLTRAALALLVVALGVSAVLSYYCQDRLRELYESVVG